MFTDHLQTTARFWSSEKNMRRFFTNQVYIPISAVPDKKKAQDRGYKSALIVADTKMKELKETSHEFFLNHRLTSPGDVYAMGELYAEKPDMDMKDAILTEAFKDRTIEGGHNTLTEYQAFA